jgi:hypothetical protein
MDSELGSQAGVKSAEYEQRAQVSVERGIGGASHFMKADRTKGTVAYRVVDR